jgi:hypothetical protein
MEERLQKIETELQIIRERNVRVESDKAWETSGTRVLSIAAITYVVASLVMYLIGTTNYLLNALIPVVGYLLSTQSLPAIKQSWIKKNCK